MTHDKPDKFARPLPSEPAKPSPVRSWRQRLHVVLMMVLGPIIFPLARPFVMTKLMKANPTPEMVWLEAQQTQRLRRLHKEYLMHPRATSKLEADEGEFFSARFKFASVLLALSLLAGGMAHKILRAMHDLPSGNVFFEGTLLIGFAILLAATLVLLLLKQRALQSARWLAAAVTGLCLILLAGGYFEAYTW